ncbi:MAG TPA: serine hydrolase domain-containing protein [Bacteroidales bacterium]|nr:serine hydrolase domain-containing protein [Bacteroidales bacterium]
MKLKQLLFSVLTISLLIGCSRQVEPELPYAMELQDVLDRTRQSTNVMGVSVAIIIPGYSPWLSVSGESYPAQPITPDMLFDMGSAGKLILAALVLDLCEDGLLSLDDPVSKYLPAYPNVDGSITIRQLLNHTSGLYDIVPHPGGPFRVPYNSIDFEKWWTIDEIFTILGGEPYFAPGEGFHYTQAGHQLATLIVEKVTQSTVPVEIQKRLFDPLGIDGMLLDFSRAIPRRFEIAHPWVDTDSDGTPEDVFSKSRNWIASLSRILFYTRAEDFAIWTHALFGGKVLQVSSLNEMLTFVHPKPEETDGPLFIDYGLSVMEINPQLMRGQRTLGHLGSIPGYRAFVGHFTDHGVTMVVLHNSDTDNGFPILDGLLETVLNHLGQKSERPPQ